MWPEWLDGYWKIRFKWMIWGVPPILGNLHINLPEIFSLKLPFLASPSHVSLFHRTGVRTKNEAGAGTSQVSI